MTLLAPIGVALAPVLASAAGMGGNIVTCTGANCTICDLADTAQNVVNSGIYILVFLLSVFFMYAGWLYVTAGGSMDAAKRARSIFTNVAIAVVLIVSSWLIIDVFMKTLLNQGSSFGPWNKICEMVADRPLA